MKSRTIGGILVLTLSIGVAACVGPDTRKRNSHEDQKISEEDIIDSNSRSTGADRYGGNQAGPDRPPREGYTGPSSWPREGYGSGQESVPGNGSPPAGYTESSPGGAEEPPPPRRFKWQDRRGHERGWEIQDRNEDAGQ